ncbi:MAG: WhiB family transcriptional regulator [Acidimicrobiales bacterium]
MSRHWQDEAACRGLATSLFFPDPDDDDTATAQEVCAGCRVQDTCLEHALGSREHQGVWGGATERDRRRMIRQRRRSA